VGTRRDRIRDHAPTDGTFVCGYDGGYIPEPFDPNKWKLAFSKQRSLSAQWKMWKMKRLLIVGRIEKNGAAYENRTHT
jgi:hypothetical protein